jgi:hypothetical protein
LAHALRDAFTLVPLESAVLAVPYRPSIQPLRPPAVITLLMMNA